MNHRILCCVIAVFMIVCVSGCGDMRDINERAYVLGIGIDRTDNGRYLYSFCCYLPVSAGASVMGSKLTSSVITVEAASMAVAVRELNKSTSHEAVLEQLACIAISGQPDGLELARLLDYPARRPNVRRQCVVVASDCSALELMRSDPEESAVPVEIASLLEQQDHSRRQSSSAALYRLMQRLEDGCDFMLFRIRPERLSGTASDSDAHDTLSITGADVYSGTNLSGTLDHEETELARLFYDRQTSGIISVARRDGTVIYYEIKHSHCSIDFTLENEKPRFDIKLRVECMLADSGGADTRTEEEIRRALTEQLEKLINRCLSGLGSAPLEAQSAAQHQQWHWYSSIRGNWSEVFRKSTINLRVECLLDQDESLV